MTPQDYDEILGLIQDDITKTNTSMHGLIPANIKLAATIWFLFTNIFIHIQRKLLPFIHVVAHAVE